MGYTVTEKLLMKASGKTEITTGELILVHLDLVMGNDITTPVAIREMEKAGVNKVFDKDKICIVLDHFTPNKDVKSAEQSKTCRAFADKHNLTHFYDVGRMGVEHALLPEQGIVKTGDVMVGADSHTCTYGALGAFSTGVGSTDMAMAMATGKAWLRVPAQIKVTLSGALPKYVTGKDVILHLIGLLGVDGALYKTLEFCGEGVSSLSMDDRFTVCNMAIECGAKNGIFPVDDITLKYISKTNPERFAKNSYKVYTADEDAEYSQVLDICLDDIDSSCYNRVCKRYRFSCCRNSESVHIIYAITITGAGSCSRNRIFVYGVSSFCNHHLYANRHIFDCVAIRIIAVNLICYHAFPFFCIAVRNT